MLSSEDRDSSTKKYKRGYGGDYDAIWQSLCLAEIWSQVVGFALVHLARI
jgi:hypothetical protein